MYFDSDPVFRGGKRAGHISSVGALADAMADDYSYANSAWASENAQYRVIEDILEAAREKTGVRRNNPMDEPGIDRVTGQYYPHEARIAEFETWRDDLAKQFPDIAERVKPGKTVAAMALDLAIDKERAYNQVEMSRGNQGLFSVDTLARVWGSMRGMMRHPDEAALNIGTALIPGYGEWAIGARALAWRLALTSAREAVVNGGIEAVQQPAVQDWRQKMGVPAGWDQAMQNIGAAAAVGGIFGFGGEVLRSGIGWLFKGRALDDAARIGAEALPPEQKLLKSILTDDTAGPQAAEALKPIRDTLQPEARGALDKLEDPFPTTADVKKVKDARAALADPENNRQFFADTMKEMRAELGKRPKAKRPPSLIEFLSREGGLAPDPELGGLDAKVKGRNLVRPEGEGLSLDDALTRAREQGYIPDRSDAAGGEKTTDVNDLLDALAEEHTEGRPRFSEKDLSDVQKAKLRDEWDTAKKRLDEVEDMLKQAVQTDRLPKNLSRAIVHELMDAPDQDVDDVIHRMIMEYGDEEGLPRPTGPDGDTPDDGQALAPGSLADERGPAGPTGGGGFRPGDEGLAAGERAGVPLDGEPTRIADAETGGVDDPFSADEITKADAIIKSADPDGTLQKHAEAKPYVELEDRLATELAVVKGCKVLS